MTLVERINLMKGKVDSLKAAKSDMVEATLLQARFRELQELAEILEQKVETLELLRKEGLDLTNIPSSLDKAASRVTTIRERFTTERKAAQLTKGQDWKLMEKFVGETVDEIGKDIKNSWHNFVEQAYSGETPTELDYMLAPTNTNTHALYRYQKAYEKLSTLSRNTPTNREDFNQVKGLASELRTIYGEFDFDVPKAVKDFLNAVGSTGADLKLLSAEVLEWLRTNSSIDRYKIVAKR